MPVAAGAPPTLPHVDLVDLIVEVRSDRCMAQQELVIAAGHLLPHAMKVQRDGLRATGTQVLEDTRRHRCVLRGQGWAQRVDGRVQQARLDGTGACRRRGESVGLASVCCASCFG